MISDKADEVTKKPFDSLKNRYQNNLESMIGSEFVLFHLCSFIFDYVHLMYYKCDKINPNRGGSYVDSPKWIKNKKAAINDINKKYRVTLNHEEI